MGGYIAAGLPLLGKRWAPSLGPQASVGGQWLWDISALSAGSRSGGSDQIGSRDGLPFCVRHSLGYHQLLLCVWRILLVVSMNTGVFAIPAVLAKRPSVVASACGISIGSRLMVCDCDLCVLPSCP